MFSDIAGVRAALKERLQPLVPDAWTINEYLSQAPTEYKSPLIIFEFTTIESRPDGVQLAPGQVGAGIDIIIGSPKSVEDIGENDVDELALKLVQVIDRQSDMAWSGGIKQNLSQRQWAWRIRTIVLTSSKE